MCVRIDKVLPLKGKTVTQILESDLRGLEKLVVLPTDDLFHGMMDYVESTTNAYLAKHLDLNVLAKANANECGICELEELTKAQRVLNSLLADLPEQLFSSVQAVMKEKLKNFWQQFNKDELFKPTGKQTLEQLENFGQPTQVQFLVRMQIQRHAGVCACALDQLKLLKRELMNGTRKDRIVAWWLGEIDKSVLQFLNER
jgi:hypothetical protein